MVYCQMKIHKTFSWQYTNNNKPERSHDRGA